MTQIENIITADEGKVFRRKADNTIYGNQISLGYTYYINGVELITPHKDVPEDFEEIDAPEDETVTVVKPEEVLYGIDAAKQKKRMAVYNYDTSSSVNCFYYDDIPVWLDKATRVGLVNSTNMEKLMGRTTTLLILNEMIVELDCDVALQLLAAIEVYAKDCYNITAKHIININSIYDIDEVKEYDITLGYPEPLRFYSNQIANDDSTE